MVTKIILAGVLAIASHGLGQTMQFQVAGLSPDGASSATSTSIYCAITGDALFSGQIVLSPITNNIRVVEIINGDAFGNFRQSNADAAQDGGSEYLFEASQLLVSLDPALGANVEPVHFATIQIEILTDGPLESGIWVSGEVTLLGGETVPATLVLEGGGAGVNRFGGQLQPVSASSETLDSGSLNLPSVSSSDRPNDPSNTADSASDDSGSSTRLFIPIRREALQGVRSPEAVRPPASEWTTETGTVSLEIQPAGGGATVTTLTAGMEYELHYDANGSEVSGYLLFAAGSDATQTITTASTARTGEWSGSEFFLMDTAASSAGAEGGLPAGYDRNARIMDSQLLGSDERGASTGHLLNFMPQSVGSLGLEFYMQLLDPVEGRLVEMQDALVLTVR